MQNFLTKKLLGEMWNHGCKERTCANAFLFQDQLSKYSDEFINHPHEQMVFERGAIFVDSSSDSNFEESIMLIYEFEELDEN